MKIFILEDDLYRIDAFKRNSQLKHHTLTFCDNVETSKALFEKNTYDILFLDHDLDNRIFVDSREPNTGYQFAKWLAEKEFKFTTIIIHSCNPYGSQRMKEVLKGCTDDLLAIPFPLLYLISRLRRTKWFLSYGLLLFSWLLYFFFL